MKRAASPGVSDRPAKLARLNDTEFVFVPGNECAVLTLQDNFDPACYISGTIVMAWPLIRGSRKVQLASEGGWMLNIEFRGPGVDTLSLVMKARIQVALRGARIENMKTSSAHKHLKFRLICEDGAIIRTEDGAVIDTHANAARVPPVTASRAQSPSHPLTSVSAPPAHSVPADGNGAISSDISVTMQKPVLERPQEMAQQGQELPATQIAASHTSPTRWPNRAFSSRPSSSVPPAYLVEERILVASSQSDDDSMEEYTAGSSTTETPRPEHHRIRKRDSRNSERGTLHERRLSRLRTSVSQDVSSSAPVLPTNDPPSATIVPTGDIAGKIEYTPLKAVRNLRLHTRFSVMGVVSACGGIKPTRSKEFSIVLYLTDDTLARGDEHLFVQCFSKYENWLPNVKPGQTIVLRKLKLNSWKDSVRAYGYSDSYEWIVYSQEEGRYIRDESVSKDIPNYPFVDPFMEETKRLIILSDWWKTVQDGTIEIPIIPVGRLQLLIQDIQPLQFCDSIVEVLKIFRDTRCTTIYVSDYTSNDRNKDLGALKYPFPSGKRTLKLALFDEQKNMPLECGPEHYYFIRNIRPKIDLEGYLEGVLNGGSKEQYCLTALSTDTDEVADLVVRRAAYWEEENKPTPPSGAVVRCFHLQQPLYSIADIVQSDHLLAKFRVRARIIEFYPHKLEDFVCLWCRKCDKAIADPTWSSCVECSDDRGRYKGFHFRFCIRVQDESGDTIDVNVEGNDAITFLSNMAPADLRENKDSMRALKARLGIIFGNLFEVHDRLDRNELIKVEPGPYFDFCVQSWIMEGYNQRAFNMFGCRIS